MKKSKRGPSGKHVRRNKEEDDNVFSGSKAHFSYEPSDSDDDYSQKEKMLLEKVRSSSSKNRPSKKVAVMDLPDSPDDDTDDDMINGLVGKEEYHDSEDDENMDSDIEGKEDDLNLPDQRAWGKTRRNYYNTDYVDQDYGGFDGDDAVAAELEEQEAREIQKRLVAELDENDFSLDVFTKSKESDESEIKTSEEIIKTDLSQLSSRQKLALLQKESPELIGIISEFRGMMEELQKRLQAGMRLVQGNQVSSPQLVRYIRTKYHLVNNYVLNMGFYLLLRARRLPVAAHPVVKRLLQYRQLLQQLQPLETIGSKQLDELLSSAESGTLPGPKEDHAGSKKQKRKQHLRLLSVTKTFKDESDDNAISSDSEVNEFNESRDTVGLNTDNIKSSKSNKKKSSSKASEMPWENALGENGDEPWNSGFHSDDKHMDGQDISDSDVLDSIQQDAEGDNKRGITYQMAKNKGLTPHRKKEQRNPRVKHRNKFRKAKVRRKGQVREPRTEVKRYGGELSGIKMSVKKSIKIK